MLSAYFSVAEGVMLQLESSGSRPETYYCSTNKYSDQCESRFMTWSVWDTSNEQACL